MCEREIERARVRQREREREKSFLRCIRMWEKKFEGLQFHKIVYFLTVETQTNI